jgi:hypothetical protein
MGSTGGAGLLRHILVLCGILLNFQRSHIDPQIKLRGHWVNHRAARKGPATFWWQARLAKQLNCRFPFLAKRPGQVRY